MGIVGSLACAVPRWGLFAARYAQYEHNWVPRNPAWAGPLKRLILNSSKTNITPLCSARQPPFGGGQPCMKRTYRMDEEDSFGPRRATAYLGFRPISRP